MNKNLQEKYLDGELLFRTYWEWGSDRNVRALRDWATLNGMKSSKGNTPTTMGIWKAMWRWASLKENKELAWEIINKNSDVTFEQWVKDMIYIRIPSAWQHPTNVKRDRFLKENGWI
jgi:hypothetical protein